MNEEALIGVVVAATGGAIVILAGILDALNSKPIDPPRCPGCGQLEIHKMCPAYGTEVYMNPLHPDWGAKTPTEDPETGDYLR